MAFTPGNTNGSTPVIMMSPPGGQDVFGATVVTTRRPQIDLQFFTGTLSNYITTSNTGTATSSITTAGQAVFVTGTGAGEASGVSTTSVTYSSGCEIWAEFTAAFTAPTDPGSFQKIGLYNSANGFFVGYIGTTFNIVSRNLSTDTAVAQGSWNVDTLQGQPGSQFTSNGRPVAINFTLGNLFRIRFGWLGYATVFYEVFSPDGNWVVFHELRYPNAYTTPHLATPSLPMTVDVSKTALDANSLTVATACWGAGVTGGLTQNAAANTSGGASTFFAAAQLATVAAVKLLPGNVYGIVVYNPNVTVAYLQMFDLATASVTLGATAPKLAIPIPATGTVAVPVTSEGKIGFFTAISIAATTTPTGSTAPGTGLVTNIIYQ